jgi:hypothetical protein
LQQIARGYACISCFISHEYKSELRLLHSFAMKSEYGQATHSSMNAIFKTPKRISITIPNEIHRLLLERSDLEGRSLSNLAAYLLESSISGSNGANGSHGG